MPPSATRVLLILLLWFAGLLAGGQFAKIAVLMPEIRAAYPPYGNTVAWLLTLVSIVGAVFGGIAGAVANRFGLKRVLVVSLLGAGLLSLWQSALPAFSTMAVSRVLEGVSHLGIVVTAPALMARLSSDRWRGATMALWSTFFGVSFAASALLGIPMAASDGVAQVFRIHGVLALLTGLLTLVLLRELSTEDMTLRHGWGVGGILASYRHLSVLWPGLGWLFYTLTFLALLTILPEQMPESLRPGMTTAMSMIGIGVSLLLLPLLLMRARATTLVVTGFALAAVSATLGAVFPLPVVAVTLYSALGLIQGGTFAAVAELNSSTAGRTMGYGFLAQTGNLGNLAGTPLLLLVLGRTGVDGLLVATFCIYLIAVLFLAVLLKRFAK